MTKKQSSTQDKDKLHPRNLHRSRYDFPALIASCPELKPFVFTNEHGAETIRFADPQAVKTLNKALLQNFYGIASWDIPQGYLCPPIPGRADYIHYLADLIATLPDAPKGEEVICLDLGVGASCIYPLLGHKLYGWRFIGSDVGERALESSQWIIDNNEGLAEHITLRKQNDATKMLEGILLPEDRITAVLCNPPFHASAAEAAKASQRKVRNLGYSKKQLNFGGQQHELWCDGGEVKFISQLIKESRKFKQQCTWFTSLVSQESHLDALYFELEKVEPRDVKTIAMGQGNKVSRILAWRY
jgi:23S rRNA (adenine1618-N6)-methyltransferase